MNPKRKPRQHLRTLFQRPDRLTEPLYVVTVVFNSARYRSRWKLYQDFVRYVEQSPAAILYTVEIAFGEREFLTEPGPQTLQLRTHHELWLKERALNLLVQRLPSDWKYVAWIDADVAFARHDWTDETKHKLQHHPMVQLWSFANDLSNDFEPVADHRGFVYSLAHHDVAPTRPAGYPGSPPSPIWWHPGYGWAMCRETWDQLGGLLDIAPLGAADVQMAYALVGDIDRTLPQGMHPRYLELAHRWQERAASAIRQDMGHVPGLLLHYWHGPKAQRRYATRGQILVDTQFNPDMDLCPDSQGLWQLTHRSNELRDRVRHYFHIRNEDSTS